MLVITFLLFALKFLLLIRESYQLCIDVSPPENGKIHMDRSYNFYQVSCDPGYTIKGNQKVYCLGREWNSAPPTCVKVRESYQRCIDVSPPENGKIDMERSYNFYQVSCDPGYTIKGNPKVYCVGREWSSAPPTCVKAVCETLTHPQNGKVECDEAPLYPGKKCVYSCFEGYVLRGKTEVRRCLLDSTWSGGPSTLCTPQSGVFCDLPPPLENGKINGCSPTNLPRESKKCFFQCNEGYVLEGPSSLTCRMHGKLTDAKGKEDMPVCKKNTTFGVHRNPPRNSCLNHNCEQLCRVINGRAQCKCETGYILNTVDKRTCKVNRPCRINNGGCEQLCNEKENKTVECGCRTGYTIGENRKSCIIHSTPEITSQTCEVDNGGCEHDCVGTSQTEVKCYCKTGYRLHPDGKHCIGSNNHHAPTNVTVNTDAFTATLTWLPGVAGHERIYVVWFKLANEGDNAWRTVTAYPDGATTFTLKNLQADREYDFAVLSKNKLGDDSVFSRIIKAKTKSAPTCGVDNGGCEQYCVTMRGAGVTCSCKTGYSLHPDGKHCVDIDECSNESLNQCQHLCKNNEGGYKCSCRPGYVLYDGHRCKGCRKNSYWSDELNGCVDCPRNSHTKSEGNPFIGDCVCNAGYTGNPGASVECEDIDECVDNRLGCSGICVNIPGGAYCTCPSGFTLDRDNKTCIDIDECSIKNGGCEGLCRNLNGSFNCTCGNGFVTSANDSYTCDDVDECLQNNGGCEQNCNNYRGGFSCSCNAGYRLDRDFKSCNEIRCPRLPLPNYSTMNCEKNKTKLSDMDYYSIGAVCKFKCFEGYKNAKNSSEEMKCLIDGTFKGTLPKCKPKHCSPLPVPENGRLHPRYCSKEGAAVKQRCTYICNPGYEIEGQRIFICQKNVTWDGEDPPICKRVKIQPDIQCPEDIDATLALGKATYNITVPKPSTNTERFEVNPSWIHVGENQEFSIGVTKITFTAFSSDTNDTAECVTTVTIMDKEPPVFEYCPDPIKIEGASGDGEFVTWKEPVVKDNVELVSVFSIMKPNVTLTPGTYFVEYIAKDSSGNTASCSFGINIIAMNCSRLADPPHGESNCMDLKYGRICLPQCDFGYMRDPDAPDLYSCDDSGVWEPSDVVSECLEFSPKNSSECEEGFELKLNKENGEEVCIECSSGTAWSSASRKCEEITI